MVDWTNGVAFRVKGQPSGELDGEDDDGSKVIICARCFDVGEGVEDLEEDDVFFSGLSLETEGDSTVCHACGEKIGDGPRAWDILTKRVG